jgi:aminopeptidase N
VLPGQRKPQEQVGADVANSLAFFANVFGRPPFAHYYATEIPYWHGQAFPGLIHLSWWTFQDNDQSGEQETFRAHEMAHQWWGIAVEPADYRDAWLAEGFATFSGLWYMQLILRDNDKYFRHLRDWRRSIRAERDDAPPIALGSRALERDPAQYDLIVYRKGAWVLHMLRNLMLDLRTMDDARFTAMMRDFYESYRGRRASTRDFQRVVERHIGGSMDWFFDEWVYGTAIPTYTLSWRAEPGSESRYLLRLRIRQEDVPEGFGMLVPLLIEFADGGQALVRVTVRGPLTETQVRLPGEPKRVQLNPLESVLAEVQEEGWR